MSFDINEYRQNQNAPDENETEDNNKVYMIGFVVMALLTVGFVGYPKLQEFRSANVEKNAMIMAEAEALSSERQMEREIKAQSYGIGRAAQGLRMRGQAVSAMNELVAEHGIDSHKRPPVKRHKMESSDVDRMLAYPKGIVGDIRTYRDVKMMARTCEKAFNYPATGPRKLYQEEPIGPEKNRQNQCAFAG
ncbi:hypothetical protein AB8615_00095 [Litorimonas sp. RW-G-Af-16]|uniref:hypothetical protein n=1 Tax=Litorimonas sp. RW-G-Af-16 TaxID=3241168 RepID=UPI003AB077CE